MKGMDQAGKLGAAAAALFGTASMAAAQDNYPAAPVKLVVGFAAGGPTDILARSLAQKLSAQMNASFVVENKLGASANIAAESVAKARPDGHTLAINASGVIVSRALGEKLGYDILTEMTPVSLIGTSPFVIAMHPSVAAGTPGDLVAYIKANPNKLAYGSGGTGTANHLAALLFLQANALAALHVPYKGAAPVVTDLISGQIQFSMQPIPALVPLVKDKRIKVVGVTSLRRSPLLPDVATLDETIMPKFEVGSWSGMLAPAKTPPAVIKRLNAEILRVLQDPDMKSQLAQQNVTPIGSSPEEYGAYLRSELERWTKVIRSAGLEPDKS